MFSKFSTLPLVPTTGFKSLSLRTVPSANCMSLFAPATCLAASDKIMFFISSSPPDSGSGTTTGGAGAGGGV